SPGRQCLPLQEVELVGIGATADPADAWRAVDRLALGVGRDERAVAGVLDVLGDPGDRFVPRDVFPLGAARSTHLWLGQPIRVVNIAFERRALRTQAATADRMIRIAFDVNDGRRDVLCAISESVNDDAT